MNALSWFKEWARRSQVHDVLEGVKAQARADVSGTFGTLIKQDEDRAATAARYGATIEAEKVQQAGLTDRAKIDEQSKALARAAKFVEDQQRQNRDEFTDASKMDLADPAAIEAAFKTLTPEQRAVIASSNSAKQAASKATKADAEVQKYVMDIERAKTPEGLRQVQNLMGKDPLWNDPRVKAAWATQMADVAKAASDAARDRAWREREPDAPKPPSPEAAYKADVDLMLRLQKNLADYPDSPSAGVWKSNIAFLEKRVAGGKAKLSGASGGFGGDPFADAIREALAGKKK